MGRYTGPACRLCRRDGTKLFLKGARCFTSKCAIEQEHPAPGMHGRRRGRKQSDYGSQLREKQKLRRQYGMREGQFRVFFQRALAKRGVTGEQLLQALESRLDNVVFRLGFAASRRQARQMVLHRHVTLNGRVATIPSMPVKPGTKVVVADRTRSRDLAKRCLEAGESRPCPSWMSVDAKTLSGEFIRMPTRDEIAPIVNEQLVVELYSK